MIKIGLTTPADTAILSTAGTSSAGVETRFYIGVKTPIKGVFLCSSFSAAFCRLRSVMAVRFGHGSSMAVPMYGFRPHFAPSPDSVETISGGLPTLLHRYTA